MKAFHSLKGLYRGGVENLVINWLRHIDLVQGTFDFGVTEVKAQELLPEIEHCGGKVFFVTKGRHVWAKLTYVFRLYKVLKQNGPYASFFSHEQFFGPVACMAAWMAGIPKRVTVAHWTDDYHTSAWVKGLSQFFGRLFVTDRLAVSAQAGGVQYGRLPFRVICTGIDTQKFAFNPDLRAQVREQLNIPQGSFVLGHVSRLSADKNLFFLVDILEELRRRQVPAVLLQCGGGVMERPLKDYVRQKNLQDAVRLMGVTPNVFRYYQAMDCFVFPSFREGLGIVAVEAQCAGLPCFISEGVPDEAMICNTVKISLSEPVAKWADMILEKTKNFTRKDESFTVRQAGFEVRDTARDIERRYLAGEKKV